MPTRKVAASGVAGALSVLIIFCAERRGTAVPPDVAVALATLLTVGAGYLRKERS